MTWTRTSYTRRPWRSWKNSRPRFNHKHGGEKNVRET
jgi:hypothetical protein